ncbi:hypothetical protein ACQEVS_32865, partial [Streptomyces sp. CA-181903]
MPQTHHRVVIAVFPDVDLLDVTGPAEVFALANRESRGRAGCDGRAGYDGRAAYEVRLAGPGPAGEAVATSAGVRLVTDLGMDEVGAAVDTLLVPGAVDPGPEGPRARIDD